MENKQLPNTSKDDKPVVNNPDKLDIEDGIILFEPMGLAICNDEFERLPLQA